MCPSAGAEPTSKQSLKYREQESPNPSGARHLLQGTGGTAHGTQMTSRKFLEAGPGTGYGLGQSLVKGGGAGESRGSDRPKKQTQAATQALVTELPAEEQEGEENGPQPWTEVVASGGDRHVNRLINLPGTATVEVRRGRSCSRMTVHLFFPRLHPEGGGLPHPALPSEGVCPYTRTLENKNI